MAFEKLSQVSLVPHASLQGLIQSIGMLLAGGCNQQGILRRPSGVAKDQINNLRHLGIQALRFRRFCRSYFYQNSVGSTEVGIFGWLKDYSVAVEL